MMDEKMMNQFVAYKTGFVGGMVDKDHILVDKSSGVEDNINIQWFNFGYKDAVDYFKENSTPITMDVLNTLINDSYASRVIAVEEKKEACATTVKTL